MSPLECRTHHLFRLFGLTAVVLPKRSVGSGSPNRSVGVLCFAGSVVIESADEVGTRPSSAPSRSAWRAHSSHDSSELCSSCQGKNRGPRRDATGWACL